MKSRSSSEHFSLGLWSVSRIQNFINFDINFNSNLKKNIIYWPGEERGWQGILI
jgi:hypothetical protein